MSDFPMGKYLCIVLIAGTVSITAQAVERYPTLAEIQDWSVKGNARPSKLRAQALRESALRVGAQAALAWRTQRYNDTLRQLDSELARIYDFGALLRHGGRILPPLVVEARSTAVQEGDTLRIIRQIYRIDEPERLVTAAPTWHTYLLTADFEPPEKPPPILLPQAPEERTTWRADVKDGWTQGLKQADRAVQLRIARLRKAFVGRVLYNLLRLRGLATDTVIRRTQESIHSSGTELRIGEEIIAITRKAYLVRDAKKWVALPQLPNAFVLRHSE
jgi:defect-in-organelle-trafficking protein DotC